jgi:hypothetical protein
LQAEDMDMGELTREELVARLESVETRMEARASATDSKIDALALRMEARANATDSKIDALASATHSKIDVRLAQFEARLQKNFADFIKWMVGTAIAMMAVGVALLIFLFSNFTPRQPAPIVITVPAASAPATAR